MTIKELEIKLEKIRALGASDRAEVMVDELTLDRVVYNADANIVGLLPEDVGEIYDGELVVD